MRFVFASYVVSEKFQHPASWLHRIRAYAGMLEALSAQHEIISIEQIDYEGEYAQNGVRYIFFRQPPGGNRIPFRLHRLIRDLSPDMVFIQGLHFPLQIIQLGLTMQSGARLLVQHHAELPFRGAGKWLQRLADRFVDGYLFASLPMGMEWVKKGNLPQAGKIHEVMEVSSVFYPIDRRFAREKSGVSGDPVFLWVGRLNKNKDPLTVLKAWLAYRLVCPGAKLYMIYATEELLPEIRTLLAGHPAVESVRLIGLVPHAEMAYWFNSADYLLSGSHYEGSGAAICEALSCGCVPVLTGIDAFRAMTGNGHCGYLYPPGDAESLYELLCSLPAQDREEKRKTALAFFRDQLSFPAIAKKIHGIATGLLPASATSATPGSSKYEPVSGVRALEASKN